MFWYSAQSWADADPAIDSTNAKANVVARMFILWPYPDLSPRRRRIGCTAAAGAAAAALPLATAGTGSAAALAAATVPGRWKLSQAVDLVHIDRLVSNAVPVLVNPT